MAIVGDVGLRIDAHLVAQHARVEIAVGGGRAQQAALERFVVRVVEPVAGLDRQVVGDVGEDRIGRRPGPVTFTSTFSTITGLPGVTVMMTR